MRCLQIPEAETRNRVGQANVETSVEIGLRKPVETLMS